DSGGIDPVAATVVDFNGDGFSDLVVVNQASGLATLLVGGEDGLTLEAEAVLSQGSDVAWIRDASGLRIYGTSASSEAAILLNFTPVTAVESSGQQVINALGLQGSNLPIAIVLFTVADD